jgi:hypothetical protein
MAMLSRLLLACVCLVIAAGLLLPLYPADVAAPGSATGEVAAAMVDAMDPGCEPCAAAALQASGCTADPVRPTAGQALEVCFELTIHLVVEPGSAAPWPAPGRLLPELPAI